jgi:hypothetical protein
VGGEVGVPTVFVEIMHREGIVANSECRGWNSELWEGGHHHNSTRRRTMGYYWEAPSEG